MSSEYGNKFAELFFNEFSSIKKLFSNIVKDVMGSVIYAISMTFTFDENKINKIRERRKQSFQRISEEYSKQWDEFTSSNPIHSKILMLGAPVPYVATRMLLKGPSDIRTTIGFIRDIGVSTNGIERKLGIGKTVDSGDDIDFAVRSLLTRDSTGYQVSGLQSRLDRIERRISDVFEIPRGSKKEERDSLEEAGLKGKPEQTSSSIRAKIFNAIIEDYPGTDIKSVQQIHNEKEKELEEYLKILNSFIDFERKVENSKPENIDEIKKEMLINSYLVIKGSTSKNFQQREDEAVDQTAKNLLKQENRESVLKMLGEIGVSKDAQLSDDIVRPLAKKLVSEKELEAIRKSVSSQDARDALEKCRSELISSFLGDGDVDEKMIESTLETLGKFNETDDIKKSRSFLNFMISGLASLRKAGLHK